MSWINNNVPANGTGLWPSNGIDPLGGSGSFSAYGASTAPYGTGDGFRPTWWGGASGGDTGDGLGANGTFGTSGSSTNGMLGQIVSLLQQLVGNVGGMFGSSGSPYNASSTTSGTQSLGSNALPSSINNGMPSNNNGWQSGGNGWQQTGANGWQSGGYGGQQTGANGWRQPGGAAGTARFANATLSSTGDPHLSVTGTMQNANGSTTPVNDHYDDMSSQRNLLSTNDFGDGFHVSTTASTANANGVTYNASATATMNRGRDSVTMGTGGAVSVVDNGQTTALGENQSLTLSGGEVVSENGSGTVTISEQNANGESLATTFSNNGSGVDVNATASGGVTLGGSLVRNAVSSVSG